MKHIAILAAALAILTTPAFAQPKTTTAPQVAGVTLTGNLNKDAQTVWAKIIAANHADLAYASAMAAAANTPASAVRKSCIDALIKANEQANGANVKNADGTPMAKPDPAVVSNIESFAETVDNLSPQGPLITNCAGAAQLFKLNTLAMINGIVTGVGALGLALPLIPVP